ncbi:MAG: NUDIX hydrolase N-terminal domain-containing protein, partial [Roseburia sp.]|nr:NUDIX hydrolase N-terminal domain-containing protein [Roseburia sp.]
FSVTHLKWFYENPKEYIEKMNGTDKDLAAHFMIMNHYGIALYGAEVKSVFGEVPKADYMDSIWYDIRDAREDILSNPMYIILNLCRVSGYLKDNLILSKQAGGEWGLKNLDLKYRRLIQDALDCYETERTMEVEKEKAAEFAEYMIQDMGFVMDKNEKWLEWAVELQSIAQAGLFYGKDPFDIERYQRIRDISAEIIAHKAEISTEKAKDLFCNEIGYQTPKLDTRAAIFQEDKILLVKEKNGTWSLPGGWVDVNVSVKENTVKEVKEEAGLDVTADLVIAIQDREKHNLPIYAYKVCKVFVLCTVVGGNFEPNIETVESRYFGIDELPLLATEKNNEEQIKMCFDAYHADHWKTLFD